MLSAGVIQCLHLLEKEKICRNAFPEVTNTFLQLLADADINDTVVSVLERFLVIMYDRTTDVDDLNVKGGIFSQRDSSLCSCCLLHHMLFCSISDEQSSNQCIWGQSLNMQCLCYMPGDWVGYNRMAVVNGAPWG